MQKYIIKLILILILVLLSNFSQNPTMNLDLDLDIRNYELRDILNLFNMPAIMVHNLIIFFCNIHYKQLTQIT